MLRPHSKGSWILYWLGFNGQSALYSIPIRSFEEHLINLGTVLAGLQAAGLTLNPDKCRFFQKDVLYLGHVVSEQGVTPDPEKSKLVSE